MNYGVKQKILFLNKLDLTFIYYYYTVKYNINYYLLLLDC